MKIAVLILAAGSASRMGEAKQLLPYNNTTLLGHAIYQAVKANVASVYCLIGANAEVIKKEINQDVQFIYNPEWKKGLGHSIATGVNELEKKGYDSVLIMLADQPAIDTAYLNILINTALKNPESCIASGYGDKLGVPAIFPQLLYQELGKLTGDAGARYILNSGMENLIVLNTKNKIEDIDTPEDYKRLLRK
ncbi:nucleotidyltransferase family protein [Leeuwenhoekiella aequorea]|uniref:nucleotidyltransferase family protein n=1 Tax=Leeuwenhoekiella aequorea TaxID=283736 RepID=UPI00352ED0C7